MRLRITGGDAGGRVLREPVSDGVRPTSSRVREALFDIVGQHLDGTTFLDAFGGSGMMGLEAWSRGALVTVVEQNRRIAEQIRRRGAEVGANWTVRVGNVLKLDLPRFDGIFADPPYAQEPEPVIEALAPLASTFFALETDRHTECPESVGSLHLDKRRRYGNTALWIYR